MEEKATARATGRGVIEKAGPEDLPRPCRLDVEFRDPGRPPKSYAGVMYGGLDTTGRLLVVRHPNFTDSFPLETVHCWSVRP